MECRKKSNQKCKKKTYLNIIKEKFKKCNYSKNQNQIKSETNGQRRPPKKTVVKLIQGDFFNWASPQFAKCWPVSD